MTFTEIFNRVSFLQSFIMSESQTLNSLFYNTLGLGAAFLLTSTRRTAGARWVSGARGHTNMSNNSRTEGNDMIRLLNENSTSIMTNIQIYYSD